MSYRTLHPFPSVSSGALVPCAGHFCFWRLSPDGRLHTHLYMYTLIRHPTSRAGAAALEASDETTARTSATDAFADGRIDAVKQIDGAEDQMPQRTLLRKPPPPPSTSSELEDEVTGPTPRGAMERTITRLFAELDAAGSPPRRSTHPPAASFTKLPADGHPPRQQLQASRRAEARKQVPGQRRRRRGIGRGATSATR